MKRLIFIISAFSVALFFLSSCIRVEEDRRGDMVAEEGLVVYEQTYRSALEPVWKVLDRTLKVDRYLKAESDYERYYLADIFFPNEQVKVDDANSCVLIGDEYFIDRIFYTDVSILESGTEWKCEVGDIEATVVSLGDSRWEVVVDVNDSFLEGYYSLKEMSFSATVFNIDELYQEGTSFSGLVYEVETSGTYEEISDIRQENVLVVVDFRTDGTVMVENGRFYDGTFELHLKCDEPVERDEDIRVQLSSYDDKTRVTVTYMGETGYWIWY